MAESSLSLGYADFRAEVGDFLGHSSDSSKWTADQSSRIDRIVSSGLRQFYFPPVLPNGRSAHSWSFLKPTTTLAIVADDWDYDLPDGFGSMRGTVMTYETDEGGAPIRLVGEAEIRRYRQQNDSSGQPVFGAVRAVYDANLTTEGQRWELIVWPTPDGSYTVDYSYNVNPDAIDASANVYPLGGVAHAETQLESCLAVAEGRGDDEIGIHYQKFLNRLAASVDVDKRLGPVFLGYNGDGSTSPTWRTREVTLTVNGVTP